MTVKQIISEISKLPNSIRLIVITGGEPFRQNLRPLLHEILMLDNRLYVQIETNGTFAPTSLRYNQNINERKGIYIVVSPKTKRINLLCAGEACAFKYVIEAGKINNKDGLPNSILGYEHEPARPIFFVNSRIYVLPLDSKNEALNSKNIQEAISSSLNHGYNFQLQVHKIIGLE